MFVLRKTCPNDIETEVRMVNGARRGNAVVLWGSHVMDAAIAWGPIPEYTGQTK